MSVLRAGVTAFRLPSLRSIVTLQTRKSEIRHRQSEPRLTRQGRNRNADYQRRADAARRSWSPCLFPYLRWT